MFTVSCRYCSVDGQAEAEGVSAHLTARLAAEADGVTLASLSLYQNPSITFRGAPAMLFGQLSLGTGQSAAGAALLKQAGEVAALAGMDYLLGPMNGSTWGEYRIPLEGEAPMFSGDLSLPAFWGTWLQQAGFLQAETYISCLADIPGPISTFIPEGITARSITAESLEKDLRLLYPLCMRAFARAPYFTAIQEDLFMRQFEAARPLLQAGLSQIVFHDDRPVAFMLAYPDVLYPELRAVVIKTIARDPDRQVPGLLKAMVEKLYNTAWHQGYRRAIHAFMHQSNRSVQRSAEFGGRLLRSYALFAKDVQHGK